MPLRDPDACGAFHRRRRRAAAFYAVEDLRPVLRDVVAKIAGRYAGPDEDRLREALEAVRPETDQ